MAIKIPNFDIIRKHTVIADSNICLFTYHYLHVSTRKPFSDYAMIMV